MTFTATVDAGAHERGREVRARVLNLMRLPRRAVALAAFTAAPRFAAAAQAAAPTTGRLLVTLDQRPAAGARAALVPAQAGAEIAGPVVPQLNLVTVRPPDGVTARADRADCCAPCRACAASRSSTASHHATPRTTPR